MSFAASRVTVIQERRVHIPSFCPWEDRPEAEMAKVTVRVKGVPLPPGFTVAEVAPERRWAIRTDGELMDAMEFHQRYLQKWTEWFAKAYSEPQKLPGKPENEAVPNPVEYVSHRVDPRDERLLERIAGPPAKATPKADRMMVDRFGENPRSYREVVCEQYENDPSLLKHSEREDARRFLGLVEFETDPTKKLEAEIAELRELLFQQQKKDPRKDQGVKRNARLVQARCGKEIDSRGLPMHERKCRKCNEQAVEARPA